MEFKQIIGVIHLPRLPSIYVKPERDFRDIIEQAVNEAKTLESLGYSGVIVENYGDAPYSKRVKDPLTLASIAVIVNEVVRECNFKVGINILRNSGREAYSIAVAAGAKFIRVNALVETIVSDSGIIEPEAPKLKPIQLNYPGIEVYADILVKHASSLRFSTATIEVKSSLGSKGPEEEYLRELVEEYIERGKANALIVTGLKSGEQPPLGLLKTVKRYSSVPVLAGSGVTIENVGKMLSICDGVIIGSYIKREGKAGNNLDIERAKKFINKVKEAAKNGA